MNLTLSRPVTGGGECELKVEESGPCSKSHVSFGSDQRLHSLHVSLV